MVPLFILSALFYDFVDASGVIQNLWPKIEPFLLQVNSPSQYIGGEFKEG
jgi:hypothetical protein